MTFLQACAFQWVNPKAWVIAVGAIAMFTTGQVFMRELTLVVAVYFLVGGASMATWLFLGVGLQKLITSHRRLRHFNIAMAVLLVFPLMVLGLASGAWGVFMLGSWAIAFGAWGPAGFLVALLAIFGLVVRLANAALDRRAGVS